MFKYFFSVTFSNGVATLNRLIYGVYTTPEKAIDAELTKAKESLELHLKAADAEREKIAAIEQLQFAEYIA